MGHRPAAYAIDPATATSLVDSTSDLIVLLDRDGVVVDVAAHGSGLGRLETDAWRGRAWIDTVTAETRSKIEASLADALAGQPARWRQVNHPVSGGEDVPMLYMTAPAQGAATGRVACIGFGRDLQPMASLQRRLVEAQQTMERDYWRYREADTRYRHLLHTSHEPLLLVDGQSQRVVESNPAAENLPGRSRAPLAGASLPALFAEGSAEALQNLLAATRTVGKRDAVRLMLADGTTPVTVSATLFRQDQLPFLLVRLLLDAPVRAAAGEASSLASLHAVHFSQSADALVYTDAQGRIIAVNRAFALMAQLSAEEQARGELLDRWLGRTGVELSVLVTNLRQRGSVGLFTTTLRGEFGAAIDVEISASVLALPDMLRLAFSIRDVSRRLQGEERTPDRVSRSVGELTELVGRVPLKDIVSETTDLIEQLCIEAALQMTQGNRASAAQLLGLSRQSLYVKLNRFGLAGGATPDLDEDRSGPSGGGGGSSSGTKGGTPNARLPT
jgi:transcriptional regulator PpsR